MAYPLSRQPGLGVSCTLFCLFQKSGGHFAQKEDTFTMKILVSSILVQRSEEIPLFSLSYSAVAYQTNRSLSDKSTKIDTHIHYYTMNIFRYWGTWNCICVGRDGWCPKWPPSKSTYFSDNILHVDGTYFPCHIWKYLLSGWRFQIHHQSWLCCLLTATTLDITSKFVNYGKPEVQAGGCNWSLLMYQV